MIITPAMRVPLTVHIAAGAVGIIAGFVALSVTKGATRHRRSGIVFTCAMLTMAILGSGMAAIWGVARTSNVPAGLLTTYLVVTALITVRPPLPGARWVDRGLLLLAVGLCVTELTFALEALSSPQRMLEKIPPFPFFLFAFVASVASIGDVQLIRGGGVQALRGAPRIARHLWRMSFALAIAALSFFLGQAKVIPKPIRSYPLLAIPPLLAIVAMFYWLWRIRLRKSLRGLVGVSLPE